MTYRFTDMTDERAEIDTAQDAELKAMVPYGLSYASCTGTSFCSCTIATGEVYSESGTYSIQGSQFNAISYSDGGGSVTGGWDYCVQNGLLHFLGIAYVRDSSGNLTPVVEQDVVAQMQ